MKKYLIITSLALLILIPVIVITCYIVEYQRIHYITHEVEYEEYMLVDEELEIDLEGLLYEYNYVYDLTLEELNEQYTILASNDNIEIVDNKIIAKKAGESNILFKQKKDYYTKHADDKKYCYNIEVKCITVLDQNSSEFTKINNVDDFISLLNENPNGKYILNNDIDFAEIQYTPIEFNGILINPNNYKIKNINYDTINDEDISSLFYVSNSSNLVLLGLKFKNIIINSNNNLHVAIFNAKGGKGYVRDFNCEDYIVNILSSNDDKIYVNTNRVSNLIDINFDITINCHENFNSKIYYNHVANYSNNVNINIKSNVDCNYRKLFSGILCYENNLNVVVNEEIKTAEYH